MKKVVIIQRYLPHFRLEFFDGLRKACERENISLVLVYGKLEGNEARKIREVDLEWGVYAPGKTIRILGIDCYWLRCLQYTKDCDMVIVQQANRDLINYVLLAKRALGRFRLGYIGHGRNMQEKPGYIGNRIKQILTHRCDWWFAYTNNVRKYLTDKGFPEHKITTFNNAIDTSALSSDYDTITDQDKTILKTRLAIDSDNIAIFCGGLYKEKRIEFLLEAGHKIRSGLPDFHLLVVGKGIDDHLVIKAAGEYSWIHYIGPAHNLEKAKYFAISKILLLPGLVGLAILDAFAMKTPMITTDVPYHSPEIDYLENGINGVMTSNDLEQYSQEAVSLLTDGTRLQNLKENCRLSAKKYTIDNMVGRFGEGIKKALTMN